MPELQEMHVQSLSQEDPLEEELATHSSNFVERILGTGKPGMLRSRGVVKSRT